MSASLLAEGTGGLVARHNRRRITHVCTVIELLTSTPQDRPSPQILGLRVACCVTAMLPVWPAGRRPRVRRSGAARGSKAAFYGPRLRPSASLTASGVGLVPSFQNATRARRLLRCISPGPSTAKIRPADRAGLVGPDCPR